MALDVTMPPRFTCSQALRIIGQALDKLAIDLFELHQQDESFYLQCGDPNPPHLSIIELRYTAMEMRFIDNEAKSQRQGSFSFVDFNRLPEILRAVGRHVETKEGQLVRVANCGAHLGRDTITLEYQTRDGRTHVEEFPAEKMSESAMRMYKERSRIQQDRTWK
jgi:hypothetical protein